MLNMRSIMIFKIISKQRFAWKSSGGFSRSRPYWAPDLFPSPVMNITMVVNANDDNCLIITSALLWFLVLPIPTIILRAAERAQLKKGSHETFKAMSQFMTAGVIINIVTTLKNIIRLVLPAEYREWWQVCPLPGSPLCLHCQAGIWWSWWMVDVKKINVELYPKFKSTIEINVE